MGNIAGEIEAAMYEAHLDEFVNNFFEKVRQGKRRRYSRTGD